MTICCQGQLSKNKPCPERNEVIHELMSIRPLGVFEKEPSTSC